MVWVVLRSPHAVRSQAWAPADLRQPAWEARRGSPHLGYGRRVRPEPVLTPVSWYRSATALGGSSLERPTEPLSEPCGVTRGLTPSEVVTVASFPQLEDAVYKKLWSKKFHNKIIETL